MGATWLWKFELFVWVQNSNSFVSWIQAIKRLSLTQSKVWIIKYSKYHGKQRRWLSPFSRLTKFFFFAEASDLFVRVTLPMSFRGFRHLDCFSYVKTIGNSSIRSLLIRGCSVWNIEWCKFCKRCLLICILGNNKASVCCFLKYTERPLKSDLIKSCTNIERNGHWWEFAKFSLQMSRSWPMEKGGYFICYLYFKMITF